MVEDNRAQCLSQISLRSLVDIHRMHASSLPPPPTAHNNSLTTYEVRYQGVDTPNDVNDGFYSPMTVSAGMAMSYTISGLMAYSAYNVSVRATNQYGVGDFSEGVTVRTEEGGECVSHWSDHSDT